MSLRSILYCSVEPGKSRELSVSLACLFLVLFFYSLFALANPIYTWDIVAYLGAVFSSQYDTAVALHSASYGSLQASLSDAQFSALVASPYAAGVYASPDAFASQLPMYLIKPAYIFLLRIFSPAGQEISTIMLMSLLPAVLFCLFLFYWLQIYVGGYRALLITLLFAIIARLPDLARVPTPDNISALLMLVLLYCSWNRKNVLTIVALAVLSITIRTNNVIFVGPLLLYLLFRELKSKQQFDAKTWQLFGGFMAVGLVYQSISVIYDHNWWRLFHHTFIESIVLLTMFDSAFSWAAYTSVLKQAAGNMVTTGAFLYTSMPFFILLFVIPGLGGGRSDSQHRAMLSLALLNFFVFLVLFPLVSTWDRFFTPFYALFVVYCVQYCTQPDKAGGAYSISLSS